MISCNHINGLNVCDTCYDKTALLRLEKQQRTRLRRIPKRFKRDKQKSIIRRTYQNAKELAISSYYKWLSEEVR